MSIILYGWDETLSYSSIRSTKHYDSTERHRISIVVPTLNQGLTLEGTLLSILCQKYKEFELIVMDGGSTDETIGILERYEPFITHIVSGKDNGQSDAINNGFKLASGDIFAWINSDDYYLPDAFSIVANSLNSKEHEIVVGGGHIVTFDNHYLKTIESIAMNRDNLIRWESDRWIMQQSCFWTCDIWNKVGGVDSTLNLLMDYDLWFGFSKLSNNRLIDNYLAVMRYYPNAKTVKLKKRMKAELAYVYAKHGEAVAAKKLVNDLIHENDDLTNKLQLYQNKLSSRVLRRLRLGL